MGTRERLTETIMNETSKKQMRISSPATMNDNFVTTTEKTKDVTETTKDVVPKMFYNTSNLIEMCKYQSQTK